MGSAVPVDSSFYIRHQRLGHDAFAELAKWSFRYDLLVCGMVMMEVTRGARTESALSLYRSAFSVMICIPTTSRIWDLATDIALSPRSQRHTHPAAGFPHRGPRPSRRRRPADL